MFNELNDRFNDYTSYNFNDYASYNFNDYASYEGSL